MKHLPNQITISRLIFIVAFVVLANFDNANPNCIQVSAETAWVCHLIAYILAIIGGVTDLIDGYLARKYHVESDFGRLIDPLADKLFIMATFSMMVDYQYMPAWILIIILAREFMVTGLRTLATSKGIVIPADKFGKLKTATQMTVLGLCGMSWVLAPKFSWFPDLLHTTGVLHYIWYGLLMLVAVITVASGASYFIKHNKLYMESI